ncbi:MAG: hypothetical protein QOI95_373 [Acidimicrobiaceae bacterium]|jgi:hypothetical protein
MRIELAERSFVLSPGSSVVVDIDVFNTGDTIDGITARIVGLDLDWVAATPAQLALFPETNGRIQLRVTLPPEFPAGDHTVTVEVTSSVNRQDVAYADIELSVIPVTKASLMLVPAVVLGKGKGRFSIMAENTGNTPVSLAFAGTDPERTVRFRFEPAAIEVPPGETIGTSLLVRGKRRFLGADTNHAITVLAEAGHEQLEAQGTFTQRPVVSRGPLTIIVLAMVVILWAFAFLFGLSKVLGRDQLAKSVPASFFASAPGGSGGAPAGAVSKQGAASADLGGSIAGSVNALSTTKGVGRITVEAIRESKNGPLLVSSAATQEDGAYSLEGLLPGVYKLRFSSSGFKEVWFPVGTSIDAAKPITVSATTQTKGINVTIEGLPGSLSGKVDPGFASGTVPVIVSVRPIVASVPGSPIGGAATDPLNQFLVTNLPTPGTYELSFSAAGYQATTLTQDLKGGEQLITNTIRLVANVGSISGTVTDGTNPLGGVIVTAISEGKALTSATPTSGAVGKFTIPGLASPQTYLMTFSKDGFGAETITVDLGPGQDRNDLVVELTGGTGSVSGKALDGDGTTGLGDVTVTVAGGTTSLTTKTLTAGLVGTYIVSGLPTPGNYTVTFSVGGHATQTVPVALGSSGLARDINAVLPPTLAKLSGYISGDASPPTGAVAFLTNATITVTDGSSTRTATSASNPAGLYTVVALPPGTYTVTVSAPGYKARTTLINVNPGVDVALDVFLDKAA